VNRRSTLTPAEAGDIILSGITKRNGMAFWAQVRISGEALQIGARTLQSMLEHEIAFYKLLLNMRIL
jgi:hypothetical protein